MNRIVLIIEWEDTPRGSRKDIDEALDHLRLDHGITVLEESPGGLFESAAQAIRDAAK